MGHRQNEKFAEIVGIQQFEPNYFCLFGTWAVRAQFFIHVGITCSEVVALCSPMKWLLRFMQFLRNMNWMFTTKSSSACGYLGTKWPRFSHKPWDSYRTLWKQKVGVNGCRHRNRCTVFLLLLIYSHLLQDHHLVLASHCNL